MCPIQTPNEILGFFDVESKAVHHPEWKQMSPSERIYMLQRKIPRLVITDDAKSYAEQPWPEEEAFDNYMKTSTPRDRNAPPPSYWTAHVNT